MTLRHVASIAAFCTALGLGACTSSGGPAPGESGQMEKGAPFWLNTGGAFKDKNGFMYASGSYDGSEDITIDQDAARAAAVKALAEQMNQTVRGIKGLESNNVAKDTGTDHARSETVQNFGSHVTFTLSQTIKGAQPVDQWVNHQTHTVYVLVRMKWSQTEDTINQDKTLPNGVKKKVLKGLKDSFDNLMDETKKLKKLED